MIADKSTADVLTELRNLVRPANASIAALSAAISPP
jgi:hypothetical protein